MRPTSITVSSATQSSPIPVDWRNSNFKLGIGCVVSAGATVTYQVEHTFDDINDPTVTPTWMTHATMFGLSSSKSGSYTEPVRAVRLKVTTWVSGSVTMTIVTMN